jgi:hypothetical protein
MFLTIASVLAPAVALAQITPASEPTSRATMTGATTGNGRGFGIGTVMVFEPGANMVPNILGTWGDTAGRFHVEGLFGFNHTGSSSFDMAARGWYHVHAASAADFSAGAGFALISYQGGGTPGTPGPPPVPPRGGSRQWDCELEFGAQMRIFIVPNVALLAGLGLGLYLPSSGASTVRFSGNVMNSVGLAYYFM